MKRLACALLWFFGLWRGGLAMLGAVLGFSAGLDAKNLEDAARIGIQAGKVVNMRYGALMFLGAAAITLIGTLTGILPGTERAEPSVTDEFCKLLELRKRGAITADEFDRRRRLLYGP